MILTNCAACAAPLAHNAPRCVRCKVRYLHLFGSASWEVRYCNRTCQMDHWRRGHKQICKEIHRGGNAEHYHADKKYKEAVAVAVEKCAADTKGQTCYICTEALHWKTKEGLVRMCSCRGTAGFVHVSCLAEQAKVLMDEGEANNLSLKLLNERWGRWYKCGLCEQNYHTDVACALGWACWKTYLGRPETDRFKSNAMNLLGNGLQAATRHEEALSVQEAILSMARRLGAPEALILTLQNNLANTYQALERHEEAANMLRDVFSGHVKIHGEAHENTLMAALNYASSLNQLRRFEEAKALLRKKMPVARRVLGEGRELTLRMRWEYGRVLYKDDGATLDDLRESVTTLEDTGRIARRVLGGAHPATVGIERSLQFSREALSARETPPSSA